MGSASLEDMYLFYPISFGDTATSNEIQALLLERVGKSSEERRQMKKVLETWASIPAPAVTILSIYKPSLFSLDQLLSHVIMMNKTVLILSHWDWV